MVLVNRLPASSSNMPAQGGAVEEALAEPEFVKACSSAVEPAAALGG